MAIEQSKVMTATEAIKQQDEVFKPSAPRSPLVLLRQGQAKHYLKFVGSELVNGEITLVVEVHHSDIPEPKKRAPRQAKPTTHAKRS